MGFKNYINSHRTYKSSLNKDVSSFYTDGDPQKHVKFTPETECTHPLIFHASSSSTSTEKRNISQDLMSLVGKAIDEWARLYHMENLPQKIVFQQALTILNAMDELFFDEN